MALSDAQVERYNTLYSAGMGLIRGRIQLDKVELKQRVMPWDRWRLRRGIRLFRQALEIAPYQWQCHFWMGKALQRLEDHKGALAAFEAARRLVPDNTTVAKEAANTAMEAGQPSLAVALLRPAADRAPQDPSLWHNLALALLLMSHADEAQDCIQRALLLDGDPSSSWLANVISEVRAGKRHPPANIGELKASRA